MRAKWVVLDALKPVPSDEDLMSTFMSAKNDHRRDCEAVVKRRIQMVKEG